MEGAARAVQPEIERKAGMKEQVKINASKYEELGKKQRQWLNKHVPQFRWAQQRCKTIIETVKIEQGAGA